VNLSDLKQYVGNVIDYDPTANPTYSDQLGRIISDAYERIYTEKPWTFCQKEAEIEARPDITGLTIPVTNGSATLAHGGVLDSTMDGQTIELDGVEYTIAYVNNATFAYLTEDYLGVTSAGVTAKVVFRYLDLPADCVTVMNVATRSNSITPEDPGMMAALTRYEDEFFNLPLGETGVPRFWVPHDPIYISSPSVAPVVATRAELLKGDRTIELAVAHEWGGRSSGLSPFLSVTLNANEDINWTVSTIPNTSGSPTTASRLGTSSLTEAEHPSASRRPVSARLSLTPRLTAARSPRTSSPSSHHASKVTVGCVSALGCIPVRLRTPCSRSGTWHAPVRLLKRRTRPTFQPPTGSSSPIRPLRTCL
jgi:hypothetical protein